MICDDNVLQALIDQTAEPGREADGILAHLESCERCQQALVRLSADKDDWQEAHRWLTRLDEKRLIRPPVGSQKRVDLSFLSEAGHPEMLGRIGRYDVESVLGQGGMGIVFRAYDSDLHRTVAIKVLSPFWAASSVARERFAREAQAAASVAHENVVPIHNVKSDAQPPYFVMRYIPGVTLQALVDQHHPLDVATILRIATQLADGLGAAHRQGLIHRDIKPANIMVGENTNRIWITDFGLARAADSMTLTQTGVIAGTPHFMSPEQARGEQIDQRSDIFSLGCVLYYLAIGRPPLDADNTLAVLNRISNESPAPVATQRDDLPPAFAELVDQLLSRNQHKRPTDCNAVSNALALAKSQFTSGIQVRLFTKRTEMMKRLGIVAAFAIAICIGWIAIEAVQVASRYRGMTPPLNAIDDPHDLGQTSGTGLNVDRDIQALANYFADQFSFDGFDRALGSIKADVKRLEAVSIESPIADPLELHDQWNSRKESIQQQIQSLERFDEK